VLAAQKTAVDDLKKQRADVNGRVERVKRRGSKPPRAPS